MEELGERGLRVTRVRSGVGAKLPAAGASSTCEAKSESGRQQAGWFCMRSVGA
jgi:hypothetical protein